MLILCDRCKTRFTYVDKVFKDNWLQLKMKNKYIEGMKTLYLCERCASQFRKFMGNQIQYETEGE